MIGNFTYEEVLKYSVKLYKESIILKELINGKNLQELDDFVSSLDSYSKYLESCVELNKDADNALEELSKLKKD